MRHVAWLAGVRSLLRTGKARRSVSRRLRARTGNRVQQTERLEDRTLLTSPGGGGGGGYDLSISDATVDEGDPALLDVTLSTPSPSPVTVSWVAHSDFYHWSHATKGQDYCGGTWTVDPCSGTLTIPAYSTTATISVPTDQDTLVENDEVFWVELSNPSAGVTISDGVGTVTIIDDDSGGGGGSGPHINIDMATTVLEDVGDVILNVTLSEPSFDTITVDYQSVEGTALDGPDYAGVSGTLTFAPMQTQMTITIPIVDDLIGEDPEFFTVLLSNPVNGQLGNDVGIVNIDDNDGGAADPALSIDDVTVLEDVGTATLTISLSEAHLSEDVTVEWMTVAGSATTPQDYNEVLNGFATIPMGDTSVTIPVGIVDDTLEEPDEQFTVLLLNPVEATIDDGVGEVTILANDTVSPAISIGDATVTEGPGAQAELVVSLTGGVSENVTVNYQTQDGTAIAPGDYVGVNPPQQLTFLPGQTSKSIFIDINDDSDIELDETFNVVLSDASANATIDDGTGVVTILDDDELSVGIELSVSVNEGQSAAPIISLSQTVGWPTVVSYATSDGSATNQADYVGSSGSVTIPANTISLPVPDIQTILDNESEGSEYFSVTITSAEANVLAGEDISTVTILDVYNPPGTNPPGVPEGPAVIEPFVLKTDTGVADGVTSDPTVEGLVTVDTGFLAGTTVQFDWNRDSVVDGSTVTDTNGWFEFDPRPDLPEGPVVMRARAQNGDDAWGEWYSLRYTYQTHAAFDTTGNSSGELQVGVEEGLEDWSLLMPFTNPKGSDPVFTIESGNEQYFGQDLFEIDSAGVLTTSRALDYEHQYQYELLVRVSDSSGFDETTLRLTVHDVPLPGVPVFDPITDVVSSGTHTLTWSKPIHADSYVLEVIAPDAVTTAYSTDSTSHTLTLTGEGEYQFRATASNDINEEGEQSYLGSFTYDTTPNPRVPATTETDWSSVAWDAVDDATEYLLWYLKDGDTTPTVVTGLTSTSWTPTGVAAGTYTAKVKALNATNESWSGFTSNHGTNGFDWSEPTRFRTGNQILVTDSSPWNNNADSGSSAPSLLPRSGHTESNIYVDDLTGSVTIDPLALLTANSATKLQQDLDDWVPNVTWGRGGGWIAANVVPPAGATQALISHSIDGGGFSNARTVNLTAEPFGTAIQIADRLYSSSLSTGVYDAVLRIEFVYLPSSGVANESIDIDTTVTWINRDDTGLRSGLWIQNHSELIQHASGSPLGAGHLLVRGNGTTAWYPDDGSGRARGTTATLSAGGLHANVITFPSGEQHHYTPNGRLIAITDVYGRATSLTYDANGRLETVTLPAELSGRTLTYEYDENEAGQLDKVNDFAGRDFHFHNNLTGQLTQIEAHDPDGSGSIQPPRLNIDSTSFSMHSQGGGVDIEPVWTIEVPQFNSGSGHVTITRPDGTSYRQASAYRQAELAPLPVADVIEIEAEEWSVVDPVTTWPTLLTTSTRTLDEYGYARSITNAHGQTTIIERNDDGQMTAEWIDVPNEDPFKTQYTYTDWGALEVIDYPLSIQERWEFVPNSNSFNPTRWIDRAGVATRYTYHDATTGGPIDALYETRIGYGVSWEVPEVNAALLTTTYQYDTGSLTPTWNVSSVTSTPYVGTARTTLYEYDENGYRDSVDVPGTGLNTYVYDDDGLIEEHTNEINATYTYTHDNFGRQTKKEWSTLGGPDYFETTTFDAAGRVGARSKTGVGPGGYTATTTYEYDEFNRMTKLTHPDPDGSGPLAAPVEEWTYADDHRTEINVYGGITRYDYENYDPSRIRLITYPDPDGPEESVTEEFWYDDHGMLIKVRNTRGGITDYTYNGLGWLIKEERPDSDENLIYQYDPLGRRVGEFWTSADFVAEGDEEMATSGTTIIWCYGHISSESTVGGTTTWQFRDHAMRPLRQQTASGSGWTPNSSGTVYDSSGRVDHTYDSLGNRTDYEYYDHRSRQTSQVKKIWRPDPDGTGPLGKQWAEWVYDAIGRTTEHTGYNGITTDTAYDAMMRVESTTLPDPDAWDVLLQPQTIYTYDRLDRQTAVTDQVGNTTSWEYDVGSNRILQVDPDPDGSGPEASPTTKWEYDNLGRLDRYQDPLNYGSGNWFTYTYEGSDDVAQRSKNGDYSVTDPAGNATTYKHDLQSRLVQTVDAKGGIVEHEYSDQGQIIKTGNAGLTVYEQFVYGKAGELKSHTDVSGQTSTTQYDEYLRPIIATYLGVSTFTDYDKVGRVEQVRREAAAGHGEDITTYEYDNLSRTTFVTDTFGHFTQTQYDNLGRVEARYNKAGHPTEYLFDNLNRVTHTLVQGVELSKEQLYDELGNVRHIKDPRDPHPGDPGARRWAETAYDYDNLSRVASETDPNGGVTDYTYDENGNRRSLTDPGQEIASGATIRNTTWFNYDVVGRMTSEVNQEGGSRSWTYDEVGNVESETDRAGNTSEFDWEFAFDGGSNYRQDKEYWMTSAGSVARTIDRDYNADGLLWKITETGSGGSQLSQIVYGYNAEGLVNLVDTFLGTSHTGTSIDVSLDYTFDDRNRQSSVAADVGVTDAYTNLWKYNALDQVVEITQTQTAVDKRIDLGYTTTGLLDRIDRFETHGGTESTALSSKYTYDDLNRMTLLKYFVEGDQSALRYFQWSYGVDYQIDTFDTETRSDTYEYDRADQLTENSSTINNQWSPPTTYTYDGNGNRLNVTQGSSNDSYDHEEANRLTSDGTFAYEYDAEGNRVRKYNSSSEVIYDWDRRNRLKLITFKDATTGGNITKTVKYTYDSNNRRISKTVKDGSGTVTGEEFYAWDNDHNTLRINADGTVAATNLYGPSVDMLFASEDAVGDVLWAVTDNQNTIRDIADYDEVANDTGIVASREYDIFGELTDVTGDVAASNQIHAAYTGREWDEDAELYYYRERYVDPVTGRFINEDPIGFAAGDVNVQRYVGNNSPNLTDPTGLDSNASIDSDGSYIWVSRAKDEALDGIVGVPHDGSISTVRRGDFTASFSAIVKAVRTDEVTDNADWNAWFKKNGKPVAGGRLPAAAGTGGDPVENMLPNSGLTSGSIRPHWSNNTTVEEVFPAAEAFVYGGEIIILAQPQPVIGGGRRCTSIGPNRGATTRSGTPRGCCPPRGAVRIGTGSIVRRVRFSGGIRHAMKKHFQGSGKLSLRKLDPGGSIDKWIQHIIKTATSGKGAVRNVPTGQILEIIAPMAKEGGGVLQVGVRLFKKHCDDVWRLNTILTRQ